MQIKENVTGCYSHFGLKYSGKLGELQRKMNKSIIIPGDFNKISPEKLIDYTDKTQIRI